MSVVNKTERMNLLGDIAIERGGRILPNQQYSNGIAKLWFEDSEGRRFQASPQNILKGHWSPYEAGNAKDQKFQLDLLRSFAEQRGGSLVDGQIYAGVHFPLKFVDASGNVFELSPRSVKRGNWSPFESGCLRNPILHMNELARIAEMRGGAVEPGQQYTNNKTKLWFIDAMGRRFDATPANVKKGRWSPHEGLEKVKKLNSAKRDAAVKAKVLREMAKFSKIDGSPPSAPLLDIDLMALKALRQAERQAAFAKKKLAAIAEMVSRRGGRLLPGQNYESMLSPLRVEDADGNEFETNWRYLKRGSWSPYSRGIKKSDEHLADFEKIAREKGGRLLPGQVYKNQQTELLFVDASGNRFSKRAGVVKLGYWSPFETGQLRGSQFDDFHMQTLAEIARKRSGRLLPDQKYLGANGKLWFEDAGRNLFLASPSTIKRGCWSPYELLLSESICRQAVEHLLGGSFPQRWGVVRRPNGFKLQLDGYCERRKIAFEYQGYQHSMDLQMQRDAEKRDACRASGILLISVDEFKYSRIFNEAYVCERVRADIEKAFESHGEPLPVMSNAPFQLDFSKLSFLKKQLDELDSYIKTNHPGGGIVPGQQYKTTTALLDFVDKDGNIFKLSRSDVLNGRWSPFEKREAALNHMRSLVHETIAKGDRVDLANAASAKARPGMMVCPGQGEA